MIGNMVDNMIENIFLLFHVLEPPFSHYQVHVC